MRHQPRRVERYWLCDQWAEVWTLVWTLVHYPNQGIVLVPLRGPAAGTGVTMTDEYKVSAAGSQNGTKTGMDGARGHGFRPMARM